MDLLITTVGNQDVQLLVPSDDALHALLADSEQRRQEAPLSFALPRAAIARARLHFDSLLENGGLSVATPVEVLGAIEVDGRQAEARLNEGEAWDLLFEGEPRKVVLRILMPVVQWAKENLSESPEIRIVGTDRVSLAERLLAGNDLSEESSQFLQRRILGEEPSFAARTVAACLCRLGFANAESTDLGTGDSFKEWTLRPKTADFRAARLDIVEHDEAVFAFAHEVLEPATRAATVALHLAGGIPILQRALLLAALERADPKRLLILTRSAAGACRPSATGLWRTLTDIRELLAPGRFSFGEAVDPLNRLVCSTILSKEQKTVADGLRMVAETWSLLLSGERRPNELPARKEWKRKEKFRDLFAILLPCVNDPRHQEPWRVPFLEPGVPLLGIVARVLHSASRREGRRTIFGLVTALELSRLVILLRLRPKWLKWNDKLRRYCLDQEVLEQRCGKQGRQLLKWANGWKSIRTNRHGNSYPKHADELARDLVDGWQFKKLGKTPVRWQDADPWVRALRDYEDCVARPRPRKDSLREIRNFDLHQGRLGRWEDLKSFFGTDDDQEVCSKVENLLLELLKGLGYEEADRSVIAAPFETAKKIGEMASQLGREVQRL